MPAYSESLYLTPWHGATCRQELLKSPRLTAKKSSSSCLWILQLSTSEVRLKKKLMHTPRIQTSQHPSEANMLSAHVHSTCQTCDMLQREGFDLEKDDRKGGLETNSFTVEMLLSLNKPQHRGLQGLRNQILQTVVAIFVNF
jgi:hypothetical protein